MQLKHIKKELGLEKVTRSTLALPSIPPVVTRGMPSYW